MPTSNIGASDLATSIATAVLSLVLLLACIAQLVISRRPVAAKGSQAAGSAPASAPADQPSGTIEVRSPAGEKISTRSVVGRWSGQLERWNDKTPGAKLALVIKCLLLVVTVAILAYVYAFDGTGDDALAYVVSLRWERAFHIFSLTYIGLLVLTAAVSVWVIRLFILFSFHNANARLETVGRLFSSFIKYGVWIGVLFYALSLIGVDSASLWASAGIVTLVVGLGAQSLIKDVIAGIFLVFEGEIRVGDIVTVGSWTGTVLEIGIRTTKIEDGSQNIKVINNSSISDVINMTKKYSFAVVDLLISYETPLEKFEALLKNELPQIAHRLPNVVAGPFYKGVVSMDDDSLVVRVVAQCTESNRAQLQRDLSRQLLLVCDHNDVAPYKGAGEYFYEDVVSTPEERRDAAAFVKEQGELQAK